MTIFTIKGKAKEYLQKIGAVVFWLLIWQGISTGLNQELLLASPVSVAVRLGELVQETVFWQSALFSFVRIVTGFFLALVIGCILAIAAYQFQLVEIALNPLISVIKSTPVASFIILCLIWIPSRNLSVFISFLMVLPIIYANLLQGILKTDQKLLEMARVFCVPMHKKVLYIYISQILPFFISACTISLGLCWKAGIAAEVIGVPSGSIGEKLYHAKVYLNTPDLFAWTIVITGLSFVFEKCFLGILNILVGRVERK